MSTVSPNKLLRTSDSLDVRPWIERLLALAPVAVFLVSGFAPAWRSLNTDFPNYYLAARLFREGYAFERVYEWIWFQRQKDHLGIDQPIVGTVLLTPPSLILLTPLSSLPPLQAKRWWLVVNLLFLLLTVLLLKPITRLQWRHLILLVFLAVAPLRNNFLLGQMHALVLLLIALAAFLFFRGRPFLFLSGVALALAAALKIYPALFLVLFILKKQWRAAFGVVVGVVGVAALCVWVLGAHTCHFYLTQLPWALRGETIDPYNIGWNSLAALLRRLFIAEPGLNPVPVLHAPWLYSWLYATIQAGLWVVFAWVVTSKSEDRERVELEWAAFLALLLLVSPQPVSYHFAILIVPVVLGVNYLVGQSKFVLTLTVIAIYGLICSPRLPLAWTSAIGWKNLLCFPRLYLMALLCGFMLAVIVSASSESLRRRLLSGDALVAAVAFAALAAAGGLTSARHFKGQFDNYQGRVGTTRDSLMAADPIVSKDGILYAAFAPEGFAVHRLDDDRITTFRARGDWFHPAAAGEAGTAWAEVAAQGASRVIRFNDRSLSGDQAEMRVEAENAEDPVVSADGEMLAFIREERGRGSLWMQRIAEGESQKNREARPIAGSEYDVRQATLFSGHRVIFSSWQAGTGNLYIGDPDSKKIEPLHTQCSAGYPNVSPDGERLAFSCDRHGTWQIFVMDLASRGTLALTDADCNSTSPAWSQDGENIIYATDCGRGLGLTALVRAHVPR